MPSQQKDIKQTVNFQKDSSKVVEVLYEDVDFLVLNKPAGLVVHPDGKTEEYALTDWINEKYPEIVGVGEPYKTASGEMVDRPGIVHRLDRETSGALVVAKNQESYDFLKKSFQTRSVKKVYHTIVWGTVKADTGVIDRPIGRSKSDFRKWSAERFARGDLRPATTEYKVLHRIQYEKESAVPFEFQQKDRQRRYYQSHTHKG